MEGRSVSGQLQNPGYSYRTESSTDVKELMEVVPYAVLYCCTGDIQEGL